MGLTSNFDSADINRSAKRITFQPTDNISSKNVQDAIEECVTKTGFGGTSGTSSYIDSGRKFGMPSELTLPITAGTECINGKAITHADNSITLDARYAALIYDDADGNTNKLNAIDPISFVDDNTIGFWKPNGDTICSNLAVGLSSLAVANDLTKSGTVTKVDGLYGGYAAKGDGSTGFYTSANSTGFPIGAATRMIRIEYTHYGVVSNNPLIAWYGTATSGAGTLIQLISTGAITVSNNVDIAASTGYIVETGKRYLLDIGLDNGIVYVYVNGLLIFTGPWTPNTAAGVLHLFSYNNTDFSGGIIHSVEIRNKMRSAQEIAEQTTKMLYPVCYDKTNANYPTLKDSDKSLAYHEYKFDETSGTSVADTAGTLSGVATGTTIVNSEIGLGKSRKFSTNGDRIVCASYTPPSAITIISIVNPSSTSGYPVITGWTTGTTGNDLQISHGGDSKLTLEVPGGAVAQSNSTVGVGKDNFIAVTYENSLVNFYVNSSNIDVSLPWNNYSQLATNLTIGTTTTPNANNQFYGTMDYLLIIPRALNQAEIAEIYDSLMSKSRKSLKSVLPANSVSLGYVETDSNGITDLNDSWWAYGRREKTTDGNRVVTMGYKSVVVRSPASMQWQLPFGSGAKYSVEWESAENANGLNEFPAAEFYYDSADYGVLTNPYKNGKVGSYVGGYGITHANDVWRTGGYIRPIFTLLEDNEV